MTAKTSISRGRHGGLARERLPFSAAMWERLCPIWRDLFARTGETSSFLSTLWTEAWLVEFGPSIKPAAYVWRTADGEPVACVLTSVLRVRGPLRVRRWFLNAAAASPPGCEHNDVLMLPEYRSEVLDDLMDILVEERADELALVGFREQTAKEILERWPGARWYGHFSESPYVSLAGLRLSGKGFLESLSGNSRGQIRRSLRLYEEMFGPPGVDVAATPAEAHKLLEELIDLHEARWVSQGQPGAFPSDVVRRFHRRLLDQGVGTHGRHDAAVDLVKVRFGPETLAVLYNFRFRGRILFYQSGVKYHDDNRLKPGLVAHSVAIQHYLDAGAEEYDFLGGETEPVRYKRSLATSERTLAWVVLPARTLRMRAVDGLRRVGVRARALLLGSRAG